MLWVHVDKIMYLSNINDKLPNYFISFLISCFRILFDLKE